ncbi:unnamed protein product [Acanthocheilonema viteae]|uniref:Uncharacterized protein n=1 Tax=Acanthocheilonema viteae TaxID=6277 RepID=A0A498S6J3_ACAVI|nr:unnamed protein product [Acanthocheilonema viteae]
MMMEGRKRLLGQVSILLPLKAIPKSFHPGHFSEYCVQSYGSDGDDGGWLVGWLVDWLIGWLVGVDED